MTVQTRSSHFRSRPLAGLWDQFNKDLFSNMKGSWQVENLPLPGGYNESHLTLPNPTTAIHGNE